MKRNINVLHFILPEHIDFLINFIYKKINYR